MNLLLITAISWCLLIELIINRTHMLVHAWHMPSPRCLLLLLRMLVNPCSSRDEMSTSIMRGVYPSMIWSISFKNKINVKRCTVWVCVRLRFWGMTTDYLQCFRWILFYCLENETQISKNRIWNVITTVMLCLWQFVITPRSVPHPCMNACVCVFSRLKSLFLNETRVSMIWHTNKYSYIHHRWASSRYFCIFLSFDLPNAFIVSTILSARNLLLLNGSSKERNPLEVKYTVKCKVTYDSFPINRLIVKYRTIRTRMTTQHVLLFSK